MEAPPRGRLADFVQARRGDQNRWRKSTKSPPDRMIAAGRVRTHAKMMLRTVAHCNPEPFAAMVPAIPEDSTCVV